MNGALTHDRAFLIGLSGAGKSAVAQVVSARLGWRCLDSDAESVRRAGVPIERIFAERGEEEFRELERQVVRELAAASHRIVALGGGAFLDPLTRAYLLEAGLVIWLQVSSQEATRRLAPALRAQPRPLLGEQPAERLRELLDVRQAAYEQAHLHLSTDGRGVEAVAEDVVAALLTPKPAGAGR